MPKLSKNKILESTPKNQLYWFLNKILSIKEIIILPFRKYDELICFPPKLLKESGIFPLGRNADATEYDSEDQEYASYCTEMLNKIKDGISKLEHYGLPSNIKNLSWEEDEGNFYDGGHNTFYFESEDKPIFEAYLRFLNGDKVEPKIKDDSKYSETNEDILLKLLNIQIKGDFIIRGKDKAKINYTDKALIYYLFYKSVKNEEECFTLKDLAEAKEIKRSERYIKNRITKINNSIKKIISKENNLKIKRFIIKENNKRGYHLNPKILLIKSKE